MRILFNNSFLKAWNTFDPPEREAIKEAMDQFLRALEAKRSLAKGKGLKLLKPEIFEIRAGLRLRVIFYRKHDLLEWLFTGNHGEVRRFLKHF